MCVHCWIWKRVSVVCAESLVDIDDVNKALAEYHKSVDAKVDRDVYL